MKIFNLNLVWALILASTAAACQTNAQREAQKFGAEEQQYVQPPNVVETAATSVSQKFDVDMGGIIVSMPGQPVQAKFKKNMPNGISMTMYQSEYLKGLRGRGGTYLVGTMDFSIPNGYSWSSKDGLDGAVAGALNQWKQEGYSYTTISDRYTTIAGLQGRECTGTVIIGNRTMSYRFAAAVETKYARVYMIISLSPSPSDEDTYSMFSSIRKR